MERLLNDRIKRENMKTNSRLKRERREADARIRQIEAKTAAQQQRTAEATQRSAETAERHRIKLANLQRVQLLAQQEGNVQGQVDDGELSPEVISTIPFYLGIPPDQITAIFLGKFRPEHLVKLRHLYNYDDDDKDQMFSITNDGAIILRSKKYIKDFGQDINIWQEGFLNYASILFTLFST
jgi:hypothetical protein